MRPRVLRVPYLIAIPILVALAVAASAISSSQLVIRGRGVFTTIGVAAFWDPALSAPVTAIDWGTVENGSHREVVVYLVSTSTVPVRLTLTTANYDPPAVEDAVTLTWNDDGSHLPPDAVRPVTVTLWTHTRTSDIKAFAFDIIIAAVG